MKTHTLLLIVCALLAPVAVAEPASGSGHSHSAAPEKQGEHGHGHDDHHEHTELGERMEDIGRAFRALSRQVGDVAKNEDSLNKVALIRDKAREAAQFEPEMVAEIPADKRAGFLAAYQKEMKAFRSYLEQLEAALKAGDNTKASDLVKTLKKHMEESHRQFRKEKDDHH